MSWPPPLRFLIPLMLLLFASTAGIITIRYGTEIEEQALKNSMRERAQNLGTRLAGMSAFFTENLNPSGAQREVALSAIDRELSLALVVDAADSVIYSTRYDLIGRALADTPAGDHANLLQEVRKARTGQVDFTGDGQLLLGAFPFPITPRVGGTVRNVDYGVVLLEFDLRERRAQLAASGARRHWLGASVTLGLTAVFWLLFAPLLTRRVSRLAKTARQLAKGDLSARAGLRGSDEMAALGGTLDQMAVDLQRGDTELRESEARLRFLVEGIPQVFWLLELDPARVLYVGPAFERVWGRRAADLYTDPNIWIEGIHPEDRDRAQAAFRDWLAGRNAMHDVTYRVVRPDGSERWVRDRGARLETSSGGRMRVIGIAEDVTEQRCREAEQKELERKLQETQKLESLGVLAGGIAHDFNNLLTGIIGNASLARQDLSATSPARPSLEQIEETALRAADLCKQMLAYSGKGRFQIQRLDLSAVVRETMRLIQLSIAKTAVLRFELADSLPSVEADATQIRQVVMNLVINASEALGGKSGVISINTGLVRADRTYLDNTILSDTLPEGQYAFLEVSDNGCGMTAEQQARIFEPFFTTKFTGRGLGLSAVLGIVRGHHGALRVYSEEGKGTTFKILLPVAEGPADSVIAAQHDGQWTGIGIVLVVDDEPSVRNVATRMLQKIGFTVLTAADGREGLDVFRARRGEIVAVLMDLTMPHMDGESAFRELRALEPGVRVILMSGFNEQEAINRFTGKGLAGFMQKPFAIETLRRKLEETLGTR